MSDSFALGSTPLSIASSPSLQARLTNAGPGALYYKRQQNITLTSYEGTLSAGQSATFSDGPRWLIAASPGARAFVTYIPEHTTDMATQAELEGIEGAVDNLAVFNVKDYGAQGNAVADDTAEIQAAIAAAEAVKGEVFFPSGIYLISAPLEVQRCVRLVGVHHPEWWQGGATDPSGSSSSLGPFGPSVIRLKESFSVATHATLKAALRILDQELIAAEDPLWGVSVRHLGFDGRSVGENIHGILFHGQAADFTLEHVEVSNFSGDGVRFTSYKRKDEVFYQPQNGSSYRLLSRNNDGYGVNAESVADCTFVNSWAHKNNQAGWRLTGAAQNELIGCKAEWNETYGFAVQSISDIAFVGCRSDRNWNAGFAVLQGSERIALAGCKASRDGREGGANFAGFAIEGTEANPVKVVTLTGCMVRSGKEGGAFEDKEGPQYAVTCKWTELVSLDGFFWGYQLPYLDGGNNVKVRFSPGFIGASGKDGEETIWEYNKTLALSGENDTHEVLTTERFWENVPRWGITGKGIQRLQEVDGEPEAPAANNGLFYARDDGGSKTQIVALFPTGAVRPVAFEAPVQEVASAGTVTIRDGVPLVKLTGSTEVTKVNATSPSHKVTFIITETAKLADGENLKLSAAGPATADDTITLICDGTNWFEVCRSVN